MKPMGFAAIRMRLASCSSTGFMKHRIAIVCCCLMVIQSSTVGAADTGSAAAQPDAIQRRSSMGPLRRASLTKAASAIPSEAASNRGQDQDPVGAAPAPDTRSWAERHPVWTGAMIGFSAGFLLTYAVAASDDHHNELLHPVGPGGPALVWGGVAAGVGALAGWGIGRSNSPGHQFTNSPILLER
jgi:hypothetical protein